MVTKSKIVLGKKTRKTPATESAKLQPHEVALSQENLDTADLFDPSVILTNPSSGTTSREEMARQMKLVKPDVPILLLSGLVDAPAGTEYTDGYIDKGQGPEKLLEAIAAALSRLKQVESSPKKSGPDAKKGCDNCVATMAHEINNPLDSLLNLL